MSSVTPDMTAGLEAEVVGIEALPVTFKVPRMVRDLVLYGLCSVAALGLDCGLLYVLTRIGLGYLPAAALSFFAGMLLAYYLSVRFVYDDRRSLNWKSEAAGFFFIGFLGLLLNQFILFTSVSGFCLALPLAKIVSAGLVFLFNFAARRSMLFYVTAKA